jgi:CRP/FNR family cyclic AMP-dependent transcriptional regulator
MVSGCTAGHDADMRPLLVDGARLEVRVLEEDPDLAASLALGPAARAAERAHAHGCVLEAGPWEPRLARDGVCLGLLILDGLLYRSVAVADRSATELLGTGDLIRPGGGHAEAEMVSNAAEWRVLERTRIAILDERFAAAVAPWPEITGELVERALRRARSQAVFAAISHMTRVDARLLFAFRHFADRWGRVTRDGIVIRMPLTHETLGTLVGARRPSVTTALGSLADRGLLRPLLRGEWLLARDALAVPARADAA